MDLIIIAVVRTEATGLRIHLQSVIAVVFGRSDLKISSVSNDPDICPTIRLQFLPYLSFGHGPIARNQDRTFVRIENYDGEGDSDQDHDADFRADPPRYSNHGCAPLAVEARGRRTLAPTRMKMVELGNWLIQVQSPRQIERRTALGTITV